jgi:hypothetical protein
MERINGRVADLLGARRKERAQIRGPRILCAINQAVQRARRPPPRAFAGQLLRPGGVRL